MTTQSTAPALPLDANTRYLRLDPHSPAFVQNPYAAYAYLHEHARAFYWEDYGIWCLAGYEEVNRALRDRRLGREVLPGVTPYPEPHLKDFAAIEANSMLELEPPIHTRLRTLVNRAFVARQVERLRPRVEALCHELIDGFVAKGEADLLPAYASPIPITIIAEMLGVPVDMGPRLLDWSHRMVAMYMHGRNRRAEEAASGAARAFGNFIRDYANKRRSEPGDDLLSLLISAHESGDRLSEDELVSSTILLLNAGHEATVHQLGNAISSILTQGGDPRRFFGSAEETAATVEECLRFDPPLHMFTRFAYGPVELVGGVQLERGDKIGLMLGAANNDCQAFNAPRSFRPGRADQKNVSFGAGIHFCIGAPLARLEMQVALKILFDRLPETRLAETPHYGDTYHFHGLERLLCRW